MTFMKSTVVGTIVNYSSGTTKNTYTVYVHYIFWIWPLIEVF